MDNSQATPAPKSSRSPFLKNHWAILGIILCVGLVLAVYALRFVTAVQPGVSHDDAEYLVLAESFATGRPYHLINYPSAPLETVWPPGYPLLILTLPWLLVGPDVTLLRALNVLLAAACAVVGYRLLRTFLNRPIALGAVLLFVLSPRLVGLATLTVSDIAFTLFVLAFLLTFSEMQSGKLRPRLGLVLSVLLLAAAILIRYWGVAFLGAATLYLILRKDYRRAVAIGGGTLLMLSPFVYFLSSQASTASDSFFAVSALGRASDFSNIVTSLITYWKAAPLVLVPLLGPAVEAKLAGLGLAWSIDLIHSLLLLIIGIGFVVCFARQRFLALAVLSYMALLLLLTGHIDGTAQFFDEPRYLVPILLFLYVYLLLGIQTVAQKVVGNSIAARVATGCAVALAAILVLRNIQQSQVTFPVADLSAGAAWAQASTDDDAVFMTPDPVSRYIYLRRHTISYPESLDNTTAFWTSLARWNVRYVMLAPPLTIKRVPNVDRQPDPKIDLQVLPAIQENPECFMLAFTDDASRTHIYEVLLSCPELKTAYG